MAAVLLAAAPAPATTVATPARMLAATPSFRHYNIDQGLPSSNVYTVTQDRDGVIWMGTIAGLVRYDGTQFTTYRHVPSDPASLASNDVSSVLADSRGRLWAGGESSGVNLFDPATQTFRHFKHQPERADSLAGNDVMGLAEGRDGSLWVGIYAGGVDHMITPGHFRHLRHDPDDPDSLISDNVTTLYSRGTGRIWIGTTKGLDILEPDGRLRHVRFAGLSKSPVIWSINGDAHDIRASTTAGLFTISADGTAHKMDLQTKRPTRAMSSVRDDHGDLWVATGNGLLLVHDGKTIRYAPHPLMPGGQPGHIIWDLMVDNEGGLWVATQNSGVAYLRPDWRDFSHFSHRPDDASSLAFSKVLSLATTADGDILVGGGTNLLGRLDPTDGSVTHMDAPGGNILCMANAGGDAWWMGFRTNFGLFSHGTMHKATLPTDDSVFKYMATDDKHNLYIAALDGNTLRVDRHTLQTEPLQLAFHGNLDHQATGLIMHDGRLWRSSHAGLSRQTSPDSLKLIPVKGVAEGVVESFSIRGDDLWLIRTDGLEHYRLDGHKAALLQHVDAAAGWPGMAPYAMTVDRTGRVWIFASAGLWRYDPANGQFKHYGENAGLPSPEFSSHQLAYLDDDTIVAGTMNGVVAFHPAAIEDHASKPRLQITSIVVRRDGHDVALPAQSRHLHLQWDDRDLRVTAKALSYIDPKENHYRFFVTGLDTDWVDTGDRGMRELAGLKAGTYQLKVQAAGPSGAWAQLDAPLTIDIDAPPWLRPWAWTLYALALLLIAWFVIAAWRRRLEQRHRMQMAHQRQRMAEQANTAKTRFLATLSHEIRTPMTGVMGMTELLLEAPLGAREHRYAQTIRNSGKLLLKLVNDALDMARIEAGRLELELAPLDPRALVEDVGQLQSAQARRKGLTFITQVDADMPACLLGDAARIKQILLNLTNNALKFTEHGRVTISARHEDGELHLCVGDTGPGISAADHQRLFERFEQADDPHRREGTGLGLAICRELVALMDGTIALDTSLGEGSRFDVFLPLPEATFDSDEAADTAPPPPRASQTSLRLLMIEDDLTVASVIRGLMDRRGHRVTHAADGLEALGELERHTFDAVLMDINLPGLDGGQLARMIRQREGDSRHLPIVAITARSGGDEEKQAREAGMDAFLRKPVSGDELAQVLDALCPHRHVSREHVE